jgi:hypothetical protein
VKRAPAFISIFGQAFFPLYSDGQVKDAAVDLG